MSLPEAESGSSFRFDVFAFDFAASELRRNGRLVKLHPQPAQLLSLLIRHAGDVVSRERIQKELWADDTFVDFDLGINSCIRQIRTALGDHAEKPLYIETVPRKGYRFLPSVVKRDAAERSRAPAYVARALVLALTVAVVMWLRADRGADPKQQDNSRSPIRSIAVLPLTSLSDTPGQDYFVDGMTDALIGALGKLSPLRVISRTSVMRYRDADRRLPEIARELNVDAIVEGSVLRSDDRVRISAALIDTETDSRLWGRSFERDWIDVLPLQQEVARTIAREIGIAMTPDEELRLSSSPPVDPLALEAYFQGLAHLNKVTPADVRQSVTFFEQAIAREPDFALPHAYLSRAYAFLGGPVVHVFAPREAMERAKASALRAIEIDPQLAEGHASLGFVQSSFERDWSGAERSLQRALELNPSWSRAHGWYADHLARVARHQESIEAMELAKALDPLSTRDFIRGFFRYLAGDFDDAIRLCQMTLATRPESPPAHRVLGLVYMAKHRYAEAVAEHERAVELTHRRSVADLFYLGGAYAASGKKKEALAILKEVEERSERGVVPAYAQFYVRFYLGDLDESLEWLDRAIDEYSYFVTFMKVSPVYDPIRETPPFRALLERLKFPD